MTDFLSPLAPDRSSDARNRYTPEIQHHIHAAGPATRIRWSREGARATQGKRKLVSGSVRESARHVGIAVPVGWERDKNKLRFERQRTRAVGLGHAKAVGGGQAW